MKHKAHWTSKEISIMRKHMTMKVSALNKLLPHYSRRQIYNKRGKMRIGAKNGN